MHADDRDHLGRYRLLAELGRGGMADVHLAVAAGPAAANKLLVIKQLHSVMAQESEFLTMFLDEGRLAVRLNHPNVVQTFEVGSVAERHFIVMEYLDGQALNYVLRTLTDKGGLPLAMHLRVLADVLGGLHYAHELEDFDGTPLGIVHRDVTPHNVFVTYDGQVKVVDFGIAKALHSTNETRTGVIKGKISYMAPEQARSETCDRRADIFSAGVMLWEALAGRRLWNDLADVTILQRLMSNMPVGSPREFNASVSDLAVEVCAKALAPLPERRYATALELQAGVESLLAEMGKTNVLARDVGRFLGQEYAENRARKRAIIEARLKRRGGEPRALPTLPSSPSIDDDETTAADTPTGHPASHTPVPSTSMASMRVSHTLAPEPPVRRSRRVAAAVGGAVALCLGAAFAVRAATNAGGAEADDTVDLRVVVTPREATISLDGRPLDANPFEGKLPRDAKPHVLRFEAPGYQVKSKAVSLEANTALESELEPEPKAPSTASSADARAASPPNAAPATRPGGGVVRNRNSIVTPAASAPVPEAAPMPMPDAPRRRGPSIAIDKNPDPWANDP